MATNETNPLYAGSVLEDAVYLETASASLP